jgi:hypothetical protein
LTLPVIDLTIYKVFLDIILICMGHHPSTHITPEVGKLSHRAVNQTTLVLYIPAPKDAESPGSLKPSSLPQDASTPKIAPL